MAKDAPDLIGLQAAYQVKAPTADRLCECLCEQLGVLLEKHEIALGVPMESRVKSWDSIEEKMERKSISIHSIDELQDLAGIRMILLFRKDLLVVDKLIRDTFVIISSEDTSLRLTETQFGYQSQHYVVKIPGAWKSIPSYSDLGEMAIEIQVRTLAQHIWAAASHKLQYKREASVPPPLRRAIYRVSALLETVDLEFSRVLEEREEYIGELKEADSQSRQLDVDIVAAVLDDIFPAANKIDDEPYDQLLGDLTELGVADENALRTIMRDNLAAALERDKELVEEYREKDFVGEKAKEKLKLGAFAAHVGLARVALGAEFGRDKVQAVFSRNVQKKLDKKSKAK